MNKIKNAIEQALNVIAYAFASLPILLIALLVNSHPFDPSGAGDWEDYEEPEEEPTCNHCGKSIFECECDFSDFDK